MGGILKNWRITLAALFSVVIIGSAYFLARDVESPRPAGAAMESALLREIAIRDSDGDGLADWEEALYGTNPRIVDSFNLGMTDGEAVARGLIVPRSIADIKMTPQSTISYDEYGLPPPPAEGTLTATFAKNFFTLYLAAKEANRGANLTEDEMASIANEAINALSSSIVPSADFKTVEDIKISGSGAKAMLEFAKNAEAVLQNNKTEALKSELLYLQDVVQNNDEKAIVHILSIAKGYRNVAVGLSALATPAELVTAHLALINSTMRISQITSDFARVNTDPLASILALQQYPQAVLKLSSAFVEIGTIYANSGVSFQKGKPGASFVNLIENMRRE